MITVAGYTYTASTNTCSLSSSVTSCGVSSLTCPTDTNGTPTCTSGTCGLNCNTGYSYSSVLSKCIATDDSDSCGLVSNIEVAYLFRCSSLLSFRHSSRLPVQILPTVQEHANMVSAASNVTLGKHFIVAAIQLFLSGISECRYTAVGGVYFAGFLSGTGTCQATTSDVKNVDYEIVSALYTFTNLFLQCGSTGNVCSTASNGAASCIGGVCGIVCNSRFFILVPYHISR